MTYDRPEYEDACYVLAQEIGDPHHFQTIEKGQRIAKLLESIDPNVIGKLADFRHKRHVRQLQKKWAHELAQRIRRNNSPDGRYSFEEFASWIERNYDE